MPNFDLSKAADFAKLTTSGAAGLLAQFTGRGESAWDVQEGSYKVGTDPAVLFHVFKSAVDYNAAVDQVTDTGGRRLAKFLYPYTDAQLTEDLGRTPGTFEIDIILHGRNYMNAFRNLMNALNDPAPGTLLHPVRGEITCKMESFQITHQSSSRKAMTIKLTMVEHGFEGFFFSPPADPSAPGALQKLAAAFAKIDAAINKVEATLLAVRSVKNFIKQLLNEYKLVYARTGANMNATFNPGGNIPAILPVDNGGVQNPDGSFVGGDISNVASPNDQFTGLPEQFTNTSSAVALATEQLFKDIQGLRDNLQVIIENMEGLGGGQGALEFYQEVLGLKETSIDMQDAFEKGKQSSQVKIIKYTTPMVMSVREVAFANGIDVDDIQEIVLLNPEIESANHLPTGTILKLAVTK